MIIRLLVFLAIVLSLPASAADPTGEILPTGDDTGGFDDNTFPAVASFWVQHLVTDGAFPTPFAAVVPVQTITTVATVSTAADGDGDAGLHSHVITSTSTVEPDGQYAPVVDRTAILDYSIPLSPGVTHTANRLDVAVTSSLPAGTDCRIYVALGGSTCALFGPMLSADDAALQVALEANCVAWDFVDIGITAGHTIGLASLDLSGWGAQTMASLSSLDVFIGADPDGVSCTTLNKAQITYYGWTTQP